MKKTAIVSAVAITGLLLTGCQSGATDQCDELSMTPVAFEERTGGSSGGRSSGSRSSGSKSGPVKPKPGKAYKPGKTIHLDDDDCDD